MISLTAPEALTTTPRAVSHRAVLSMSLTLCVAATDMILPRPRHGGEGRGEGQASAMLDVVVLPVPLNEIPNADLNRRIRPISHVAHQILDVGARIRHVAGLQRQQVQLSFLP